MSVLIGIESRLQYKVVSSAYIKISNSVVSVVDRGRSLIFIKKKVAQDPNLVALQWLFFDDLTVYLVLYICSWVTISNIFENEINEEIGR